MFSGIVETTSSIVAIEDLPGRRSVAIRKPRGWRLRESESVCVEGVCSTVQTVNLGAFKVIYMPETLRRSTLGDLRSGSMVNLERSLTLQSLIGGHLVQGHVDATARILRVRQDGAAAIYEFAAARGILRYIVEKGSVAVDGVSLTVASALRDRFTVSLLEYTLGRTTLGRKGRGSRVNIEVDVIAKYTEKLLAR
ncbi:MAG: riboflavin synthase [Terriglobia bacterium]